MDIYLDLSVSWCLLYIQVQEQLYPPILMIMQVKYILRSVKQPIVHAQDISSTETDSCLQ